MATPQRMRRSSAYSDALLIVCAVLLMTGLIGAIIKRIYDHFPPTPPGGSDLRRTADARQSPTEGSRTPLG